MALSWTRTDSGYHTSSQNQTLNLGPAVTGRTIVIVFTYQNSNTLGSGATLGGETMFVIRTLPSHTTRAYLFYEPDFNTGTTATFTTPDANVGNCGIDVYALTGGHGYYSGSFGSAVSSGTASSLSDTVNTAADGFHVSCYANDLSSTSISWTNSTEETEYSCSTFRHSSAVRTTSGSNVTITASATNADESSLIMYGWESTGYNLNKFSGVDSSTLAKADATTLASLSKLDGITL